MGLINHRGGVLCLWLMGGEKIMQRLAFFDNAKVFFIFLVVFGHLIQPMQGELISVDALYQWIYIFHIPGFVLMSGYFAKGRGDQSFLVKMMKKLLLPFLLFQVLYSIVPILSNNDPWYVALYEPHWSLWFLVSLFCWHLLLIVFKHLSPIKGLMIAFSIGLGIGLVPFIGHEFSVSRTFVFFPFFLMGYWMDQTLITYLKEMKFKVVAVLILATLFVGSLVMPVIPDELLFGSASYSALGMESIGIIARLSLYALAILMVFSVLALIPNKNYQITAMGPYTLYVYLLHGVIIQFVRELGLLRMNENLDVLALGIIAGAIVMFLSSRYVLIFTQPIIEMNTVWAQKWLKIRSQQRMNYGNHEST